MYKVATPEVHVIALTQMVYDEAVWATGGEWDYRTGSSSSADDLAEFAGRNCYQSWSNPATKTNKQYLGNIIEQGHFSVLEHGSVTLHISGVSRSLTHELVRHRHFSYSQLSQRYVDENDAAVVVPPDIAALKDDLLMDDLYRAEAYARQHYKVVVDRLQNDHGFARKAARSAARSVLPNMWTTQIVITGNHRAWREFLSKRLSPAADAEIRELAQLILRELRAIAPNTYQDFA
jgi:thymidylate synthase (FAD)